MRKTILRYFTAFSSVLSLIGVISFADTAVSQKPASQSHHEIIASPKKNELGPHMVSGLPGLRGEYGLLDAGMTIRLTYDESEESPWFEHEKKFYRDILTKRNYDVLVVPFQTQYNGIDLAGRMLMTYRLAAEIESRTGLSVAPLQLVYPVLGLHNRFLDEGVVRNLANRLKVSSIVWGYAGCMNHKNKPFPSATIAIIKQSGYRFDESSPTEILRFQSIPMPPEKLPYMIFEERINETISFLLGTDVKPKKGKTTNKTPNIPEVPNTVEDLLNTNTSDSVKQSFLLQFLGILTPQQCENHRSYLFIRSIVNIADADPNHPLYRLLKARAFYYLHRRPAAMKVLENPETPEEKAFIHFLNGDLYKLESAVKKIKPSIAGFMAQMELFYLSDFYNKHINKEDKELFASQYPEWFVFILHILNEYELWEQYSNIELKTFLDTHMPIEGLSMEHLSRATIQKGPFGDDLRDLELTFHEHIRKVKTREWEKLGALSPAEGPNLYDLLVMADGVGITNLMRKARFLIYIQCSYQSGLDYCEDILELYKGHPYFTILKAWALAKLSDQKTGIKKSNMRSEVYKLAKKTFYWTGTQNWAFREANYYLYNYPSYSKNRSKAARSRELLVARDYPPRPFCVRHLSLYPQTDLIQWTNRSITDLAAVVDEYITKGRFLEADSTMKVNKSRFNGHPKKTGLMLKIAEAKNDTEKSKQICLGQIEKNSVDWLIYKKLAGIYIDEAAYEKAAEVFHSYPLLKDEKRIHSVERSNKAYHAGKRLFWKGASDLSRPFFEYSAGLHTGSGASLTSAAYLALLDHQITVAAGYFLSSGRRYNNAYDYNDYMCCLHFLEQSNDAWALFKSLLGRYQDPIIWNSAWVGHRFQNIEKEQLKKWLKEMSQLNQTSKERSFPARYGLMCLIDRKPDYDMAAFIESIDDISKYKFNSVHRFYGPQGEKIGPGRIGIPKATSLTALMKTPPESVYGSFAKAYELIKEKKFAEAYDVLYQRSRFYGYQFDMMTRCFQSYYVWVGLKSNHKSEIENFLRQLDVGNENLSQLHPTDFDAALSCAAYCASVGRHKEALNHLKKAFALRPWTKNRHFDTWYQITELATWLYEDSGFSPYRDLALQYAKAYQVIQPWYSWAYTIEAKYGSATQDRIEALAVAQFLDPQSGTVAEMPEPMKKKAMKWFKIHNPFQPKPEQQKSGV